MFSLLIGKLYIYQGSNSDVLSSCSKTSIQASLIGAGRNSCFIAGTVPTTTTTYIPTRTSTTLTTRTPSTTTISSSVSPCVQITVQNAGFEYTFLPSLGSSTRQVLNWVTNTNSGVARPTSIQAQGVEGNNALYSNSGTTEQNITVFNVNAGIIFKLSLTVMKRLDMTIFGGYQVRRYSFSQCC